MKLPQFIRSNIGFVLFMIAFGIVFISADAKTFVIKNMMRTGLFNANVPAKRPSPNERTIPPNILFKSAGGEIINLSDLKGKVVFINFWTTWCPPCRAEMPSINSLYNKVSKNKHIVFLMVDADSNLPAAAKFMKRKSYQLPVVEAASAIPPELFGGSLPTTLIIAPDGRIVFQHAGMANYDKPEMLDFLNGLLKPSI